MIVSEIAKKQRKIRHQLPKKWDNNLSKNPEYMSDLDTWNTFNGGKGKRK